MHHYTFTFTFTLRDYVLQPAGSQVECEDFSATTSVESDDEPQLWNDRGRKHNLLTSYVTWICTGLGILAKRSHCMGLGALAPAPDTAVTVDDPYKHGPTWRRLCHIWLLFIKR